MSGWGPYSSEVSVDFTRFYEEHLFLITGSTGAGKTTIFDAISFALYGDVSGKIREKTSVRSDFAATDTDTYIELTFSHSDVEYRIVRSPRYLRPKKRGEGDTITNETAQLFISDKEPIVSVNEVNRMIEQIMGIDYGQFKKIVMIAQGEFLELLISSSKDRVEILRSLFQTDQYEKLQYRLKEKANDLYRKIENIKNKMDEAANLIDQEADEELSDLKIEGNYIYDKIIPTLQESIKVEKTRLEDLENKVNKIEEAMMKQVVSITEGEQLNEMLQRLEQATIQYDNLADEKDNIVIQEECLKKAVAANKVKGEERFYQEAFQRMQSLEKRIKELEQEKEELKPLLTIATEEKTETEKKGQQIEIYREELTQLEGYLPLLKEYVELGQMQAESKDKLISLKEKQDLFISQIQKYTLQQEEYQAEYTSYHEVEKKIGEYNLLIEQGKNRSHSFVQAKALVQEIYKESKDLEKLYMMYEKNCMQMKEARQSYQEKEEIYRDAIVGVVAKLVQDGEPCPVCGSLEHPNIAKISHKVPDEQELDKLRELVEERRSAYDKVYQESIIRKAHLEEMEDQLIQLVKECTQDSFYQIESDQRRIQKYEELLVAEQEAHRTWCIELEHTKEMLISQKERRDCLKDELQKVGERIDSLEEELKQNGLILSQIQNDREHYQRSINQIQDRIPAEILQETSQQDRNILEQIKERIEENRKQIQDIQEMIAETKKKYDLIQEKTLTNETLYRNENVQYKVQKLELERKKEDYQKALLENHFLGEEEYKKAMMDVERIPSMENKIKDFYNALQALEKMKETLTDQIKGKTYVDIAELRSKLAEWKEEKEDLLQGKDNIKVRIINHQKILTSIRTNLARKQELEREYGVVKDLDNITRGQNKERLVFEQYILASYFEDVIRAANIRLTAMTNGRYELYKIHKVADARTTDSLNLEVLDHYTGKKRSVKTLSGGESFKAALSLALGLSDIVQNNAGGIQIETLFIDEGFGALDTESLDQALHTLMTLSAGNRLIGIISHVNELKERIDHQVIVEKGNHGSHIRIT